MRKMFLILSSTVTIFLTGCLGMPQGAAVGALTAAATKGDVGRSAAAGALVGAAVCATNPGLPGCGGFASPAIVTGAQQCPLWRFSDGSVRPHCGGGQQIVQQYPGGVRCHSGGMRATVTECQAQDRMVMNSQAVNIGGQMIRPPMIMGGQNGMPQPQWGPGSPNWQPQQQSSTDCRWAAQVYGQRPYGC